MYLESLVSSKNWTVKIWMEPEIRPAGYPAFFVSGIQPIIRVNLPDIQLNIRFHLPDIR